MALLGFLAGLLIIPAERVPEWLVELELRSGSWFYDLVIGDRFLERVVLSSRRCAVARGSITQRVSPRTSKVSWRGRWECRKPDGSRGQCSETAPSEEDYRLLRKRMTEVDEGKVTHPTRLTVGEYLEEHWLPAYTPTVAATTAAIKERHARLHLVPRLGGIKLAKLTKLDVLAAYRALTKRLTPSTIAIVHRTLLLALSHAVESGTLARNVASGAKPPRVEPREGSV